MSSADALAVIRTNPSVDMVAHSLVVAGDLSTHGYKLPTGAPIVNGQGIKSGGVATTAFGQRGNVVLAQLASGVVNNSSADCTCVISGGVAVQNFSSGLGSITSDGTTLSFPNLASPIFYKVTVSLCVEIVNAGDLIVTPVVTNGTLHGAPWQYSVATGAVAAANIVGNFNFVFFMDTTASVVPSLKFTVSNTGVAHNAQLAAANLASVVSYALIEQY